MSALVSITRWLLSAKKYYVVRANGGFVQDMLLFMNYHEDIEFDIFRSMQHAQNHCHAIPFPGWCDGTSRMVSAVLE
ncbi:hypothetical protein QM565_03380 [Geitlerinema splendidum]|nr:hypothetical protein [Geitlerinema splendidum]